MIIAIISVCSFISCQCMHLMVIEWINWLIIFAVRKGNIISFNIVKTHFTLKTPSLPMQQIIKNLWEDLKTLWVFGFFVELLVVWGFVCVWRVGGGCFFDLVCFFGFFGGWRQEGCVYLLEENCFEEISQTGNRQVFKNNVCPIFASWSEHPGFTGLGLSLNFDGCCGPQSFQTVFFLIRTLNHWDPKSHAHITNRELENV